MVASDRLGRKSGIGFYSYARERVVFDHLDGAAMEILNGVERVAGASGAGVVVSTTDGRSRSIGRWLLSVRTRGSDGLVHGEVPVEPGDRERPVGLEPGSGEPLRTLPRMQALTLDVIMRVVFGAALLYGDGMITPAISVLSAVEGITVYTPQLEGFILPATVAILVARAAEGGGDQHAPKDGSPHDVLRTGASAARDHQRHDAVPADRPRHPARVSCGSSTPR